MSTELEIQVAELVNTATDGDVSVAEALAESHSLALAGVSSLAYLRLIELVERWFSVTVDLESDVSYLDTVQALAKWLESQ